MAIRLFGSVSPDTHAPSTHLHSLGHICYIGLSSYRSTPSPTSLISPSRCLDAHPATPALASAGPNPLQLFTVTPHLSLNPSIRTWRNSMPLLLPLQLSHDLKLKSWSSIKQIEASSPPEARVLQVANHSHHKAATFLYAS